MNKKTNLRKIVIHSLIFLLAVISMVYNLINGIKVVSITFLVLGLLSLDKYSFKRRISQILIMPLFSALFTMYFTQLIIIIGTVLVYTQFPILLIMLGLSGWESIVINILVISLLYLIIRMFGASTKLTSILTPIPFLLLGLSDYFVIHFRNNELIGPDFFNIGTAMDVVEGHSFSIIVPVVYLLLPYIVYLFVVININYLEEPKNSLAVVVKRIACVLVFSIIFIFCFNQYSKKHMVQTYGIQPSQQNTFINNLLLSFFLLSPGKPDGYSVNTINDYAASNLIFEKEDYDDEVNIIVIMNEAYSDINIYENKLNVNVNNTPFFYQLSEDENSISGYYLASVFGGNTANSEFEMLTGVSMAFMPRGTVPYSLYINSTIPSLAGYLDSLGYKTVGMHPSRPSNYRRESVYDYLGFERTVFRYNSNPEDSNTTYDDFEVGADDLIRDLPGDRNVYKNVLRVIDEEHEAGNDKVFTFVVTIQNHSSFENCYDFDNFVPEQYLENNSIFTDSSELNGYLSLINESDKAFEELINELKQREDKYVVFMFGDHQPNLTGWEYLAEYPQQRYEVPFILWANYDVDSSVKEEIINQFIYDDSFNCNTSINYCGIDILKYAHIPLSAKYQALSDFRAEMPIINSDWYYDIQTQGLVPIPQNGKDVPSIFRLYSYLAYDLIFDKASSQITE